MRADEIIVLMIAATACLIALMAVAGMVINSVIKAWGMWIIGWMEEE